MDVTYLEKQLKSYMAKSNYLLSIGIEVDSFDFYRDIFPLGSFERKGNYDDNKPNGIILEILDGGKTRRRTITDDLKELLVKRDNFTITSPISYYGNQRSSNNARFLYALTFDLDGVSLDNLKDLEHQMKNELIPKATYLINSGNGLHLYYVFKEPIPMYPHNQKYLKEVKYALTKRIWNDFTSSIEEPQMQGITQGFRVIGTPTKFGKDYIVRAFKYGDKWTVDELISFIPDVYGSGLKQIKLLQKTSSNLTLEKAKELYPNWYQKRIVENRPKGKWIVKRALYDWWLRRISSEIKVGHRYYGIMTLAIYAKKCDITLEELTKDAFSLLEHYDRMSTSNDNRFEKQHIIDALELYNDDFITFPRDDISKLTGLVIQKNKRNGRKQDVHLKMARFIRDEINKNTNWQNKHGRPTLKTIVEEYQEKYPSAKPKEIIKYTGLSKNTVYKYYIKKEV